MLLLALLLSARLAPPSGVEYKQPQVDAAHGVVGVTFGAAHAVYFAASRDGGRTFTAPVKVAQAPHVALGRHRGPRIAITPSAIVISAVTASRPGGGDGDVTAWRSTDGGRTWSAGVRVNDVAASAREGLHAMAGTGGTLYAAWLDLRAKGTRLYGARSGDGGATWSPNVLVYQSPDGTICECCHPSLALDGHGAVYAMWRNALGGNRDMYLARSGDGGRTWGEARKLGTGTWPLKACPMDGGGLALDASGNVLTVWRRRGDIFQGLPDLVETPVGRGKDPAVAAARNGVYIAWTGATGGVQALTPAGPAVTLDPQGAYVQLAALAPESAHGAVLAAWESGGGIAIEILP